MIKMDDFWSGEYLSLCAVAGCFAKLPSWVEDSIQAYVKYNVVHFFKTDVI